MMPSVFPVFWRPEPAGAALAPVYWTVISTSLDDDPDGDLETRKLQLKSSDTNMFSSRYHGNNRHPGHDIGSYGPNVLTWLSASIFASQPSPLATLTCVDLQITEPIKNMLFSLSRSF